MLPGIKLIALAVAATLAPAAAAKTSYVDVFGDDGNDCSRSAPCETIGEGVTKAGANGRIIVGPGTYSEAVVIDQDGVRLTSVAGANATTIMADPGSGVSVVNSSAGKTTIGQRRKGFTILMDHALAQPDTGIWIAEDRAKVEGNIIDGTVDGGDDQDFGVLIEGKNATVRHNQIYNFRLSGIELEKNESQEWSKEKYIVSDNEISVRPSQGSCIDVQSGPASANKILNNRLHCYYYGISNSHSFPGVDNETKTNDRLQGNVIDTFDNGIYVTRGNPNISKNLIRNAATGVYLENTYKANVKDNLLFDPGTDGVLAEDPGATLTDDQLTISGNTILNASGGTSQPIRLDDVVTKQVARNNLLGGFYCPMDVRFDSVDQEPTKNNGTLALSKNFWGDLNDSDGIPDEFSNCTAGTEGFLTLNPSLKPNPVKFKSPF